MFISAGRPVLTECQSTLADGLAVPLIGANAYATAAPLVDRVVCVKLVFIKETKEN
jgi:threonine dehydratase